MADFEQSREVGNLTASDAIRALKALQREARKATQALRELESEVAKAKIAKELVDDVFEKLEREQYRDFIERENE